MAPLLTNEQFATKLERLAQIYRANPELPQVWNLGQSSTFVFCHSKEQFALSVKAFSPGAKSSDADSLVFTPEEFPFIKVNGFKTDCCQRIQTGIKVIPARHIPAQAEVDIPALEIPTYEWICAPFLDTQSTDSPER